MKTDEMIAASERDEKVPWDWAKSLVAEHVYVPVDGVCSQCGMEHDEDSKNMHPSELADAQIRRQADEA